MKSILSAAALVFVLATAGCLDAGKPNEGEDPGDTAVGTASRLFRAPVQALECASPCGEATIAWLPDGTLVALRSSGRELARSVDDGRTFVAVEVPLESPNLSVGRGDAQLQVGPDGRLWLSHLVLGAGPTSGVRVMSSTDGGLTWDTDAVANVAPGANAPDRQWLIFIEDDVYVFAISPAGVAPYLFVSHDGGQSFQGVGPVIVAEARYTPWGFPSVLDGHIVIPFFAPTCNAQTAGRLGVVVAVSAGGDQTSWASSTVMASGGTGILPCGFPFSASNGTSVGVAWNRGPGATGGSWNGEAGVAVSFSSDGQAWSEPQRWGNHAPMYPHPWIQALADGRFAVLSYSDQMEVILMIGDDDGPSETWSLGVAQAESTDLPHLSVGPDGRIAAVWIEDGDIFVAAEETGSG